MCLIIYNHYFKVKAAFKILINSYNSIQVPGNNKSNGTLAIFELDITSNNSTNHFVVHHMVKIKSLLFALATNSYYS